MIFHAQTFLDKVGIAPKNSTPESAGMQMEEVFSRADVLSAQKDKSHGQDLAGKGPIFFPEEKGQNNFRIKERIEQVEFSSMQSKHTYPFKTEKTTATYCTTETRSASLTWLNSIQLCTDVFRSSKTIFLSTSKLVSMANFYTFIASTSRVFQRKPAFLPIWKTQRDL